MAEDFRDDDEPEGGLDEELLAEFLDAVAAGLVLVALMEAGEAEDGVAVLGVEGGGAREEADWEELVWRLDGIFFIRKLEREGSMCVGSMGR